MRHSGKGGNVLQALADGCDDCTSWIQIQLFEEVPELAARAISQLLQAHPGVVDRLVDAGGVLHLCKFVVLTDVLDKVNRLLGMSAGSS